MKKLISTYLLNIIAAVALMMTAAACVDDTDLPEVAAPGTSVTIRIPNPAAADAFARSRAANAPANAGTNAPTNVGASGSSPAPAAMSPASRAPENDPTPNRDLDAELNEGKIKTLWLLAYNTDNSDYNVIRQLQPSDNQLTHEYRDYRIEFKPGKYRIYVVANLDPYITKAIGASTTEEELKELTLNFSPDKLPNTDDGLPMACLPAQVDDADTGGIITVEAGTTKTIQTDLTFLCAKVRYTILFDNSEGGFSHDAFDSSTITFNSASLTGVIPSTPLYGSVNAPDGAFNADNVDLKAVNAPNALNDLADPGFTPSATGAQRAWQGTLYLPENLLTGADARTILHLGATLDGNGANLSYTVKLPKNAAETDDSEPDYTLTRGHFYDLVGKVTTIGDQIDITASVADWTLQTLTYDLHGPYFLHVEKTEIKDLVAGLEETITYETDAPDITFESCLYQGKKLFEVTKGVDEETGKNYISVKVNPEIAASGETITDDYWFDIIAANLHKRILVTPVKLTPFLNVTPTEIEINIAEYIASGDYVAEIPIQFTTNLPSVTITGNSGWDKDAIELGGTLTYTDQSQGTNTLKVKGFNSGIWTAEQSFQLTYTAENGTNTETETVKITVKPNLLNYLIHFRVPKGWTSPHIYVYQCLQLPATHPSYPSKTLGYKDVYTENGQEKANYLSALEYSFTGKVAFKGWNYTNTNDVNYYDQRGGMDNGFYIFNNYTYWNCTADYNHNKEHYYFDLDFCTTYRDSISGTTSHNAFSSRCSYCGNNYVNVKDSDGNFNNGYNMLWPGIMMRDDGNDWWTFELTGTATPGKALIMFTDSHNESSNRYPDALQPGVPLFDYPSREGWFDLAAGATQFTSTPNAPKRTYRIYWPQNNNSTNKNFIHIWLNGPIPLTDWATNTGKSDASNKFYYDDFEILESCSSSTRVNYQLGKSGDNWNKYVTLSQFTKIKGENVYAITLDNNGNYAHSGTPDDPASQPDVTTYRLYWPYASTSFNGVNFWNDSKAWGNTEYNSYSPQSTNNGTYKKSSEYPGYAYLEFTETSTAEFHCQHIPGYSHRTDNIYLSNFSGSGNIKSYTLNPNSSGGHSGTPIISNTPTYRIWWFKDDRNACHIEGFYTGGDPKELNHGEATYGGRPCYFYDIQTDKDPIKVWLYKQENNGYTNEYVWDKNNNSNASKFSSTSGQYFKYETLIY